MKKLLLPVLFLSIASLPALADPDADVAQRQQLFREMQTALASLDIASKSGDIDAHRDAMKTDAQKLAQLSAQPWTLFSRETTIARRPSHAGPMIWSDPAGYRAAAGKLMESTQILNAAVAKGSADDLKKNITAINAACEACHQTYRQ